jgi:hypothetical protein
LELLQKVAEELILLKGKAFTPSLISFANISARGVERNVFLNATLGLGILGSQIHGSIFQ